MTPNLFEPRRLRESPQRPGSVEGRLARQLRVLSVYAPTPQLRRYSALPRRRRYILTAVRVAAVATLVLAVSGVATAMAAYVVRRVWPSPVAVDGVRSLPASPAAKHRGRVWEPSEGSHVDGVRSLPASPAAKQRGRVWEPSEGSPVDTQSSAEPGTRLRDPDVEVAAVVSSTATPSPEHPASLPQHRPRLVAAKHTDGVATEPPRPPEKAPPTPAQTVEPAAWPSLPLPTGTTSPGTSGPAPSQVRTDSVTQEAGLLRQALAALRRDHDAKRALALLDDYDRRFGQGALSLEATSARAQVLLQLGENARALEFLDRLPLWREGRELRVIRGELRSLSGRCQDALSDFDAVLRPAAGNAPDEVARALFGRASCRARTGDLVGAEEDRQRYLKEFPKGPAARQHLSQP